MQSRHPNKYHYIIINEAYGHYFKHSTKRTTDQDQKVQWFLAKTLVHEIMHAYYARDMECPGAHESAATEPIMDSLHKVGGGGGDDSELGQEPEYILWGVYMQYIMHPTLKSFPQHHHIHFGSIGYNINPCLVISPTCPEWITSWFQKGKWVRLEQEWSKHLRHLLDHECTDFYIPQ